MQLLPVLLRPKPKARQPKQHLNLKFTARTFTSPATAATITTKFFNAIVINALILMTTTWGITTAQQPAGNYEGVSTNADVVSALTGLSNGYATPNYIKNYYQVSESGAAKQQQQHNQQQQQHQNNAAAKLGHPEDLANAAGMIGRSFVGLQPNNYGNMLSVRGGGEDAFNVYDGGFVPTTFTAAGQHYAASLAGLQTDTDKINALHQYATTAANKNNLQASHQPYGNVNSNSNSNDIVIAEVDNNKAQHSLFRRLTNYGGLKNGGIDGAVSGNSLADASGTGLDVANGNYNGGAVQLLQNYALTYNADKAQQSSMLQNFYNQQNPFNAEQSVQEQTLANYFPQSMPATAGYQIENQPKYYTLNSYQQSSKPQQQHQQQQQQFEQQQYLQYQQQSYEHPQQQQQQQTFNKKETLRDTPAPASYYPNYMQHKNDNKEHQQQNRNIAADNYHRWRENQILPNYQPKQTKIENSQDMQQQQQQVRQQFPTNNHYHQQNHSIQEPETAETSHNARIKKSSKHKSKRHDNQEANDFGYSYDTHGSNDFSAVQIHQLERLQEQLQHQQQQFIELQHQLIDHDQQLQIQKHIANTPTPTLPPITQTVQHNPHSLQALAGSPLAKHTQIIKTIPIPQLQQVHVPYRENVTIEIPNPVITPIRKPFAIQIPITRTVAVPKIQEVKIPIEKLRPFPVERPIPYIVEKRVPYPVEKQIAQPVYYPVPIKVPILHTVIHKLHKPPSNGPQNYYQNSFHLPHTVYQKTHHGHGHGHGHAHSHYY